MRVFLDANILFTAAYSPNGKARFLLENHQNLKISFLTCELAVMEAQKNLELKAKTRLPDLKLILRHIEVKETLIGSRCPISLPEKDQPIFLSAMKYKCSHLITGDKKDFGAFMNKPKKSKGILIQTMADFWTSVLK